MVCANTLIICMVYIYIQRRTCTQLNKRVDRNYCYYVLDTCHVPTNVILPIRLYLIRNALYSNDITIIIM